MEEENIERTETKQEQGKVSLARKVSRMEHLLHRYYTAGAHRHGSVGDPLRGQGRVLALLSAKPETTQRELSFLLDMRQQSLSELLSKLEEKGYVTREKSADDGRVTRAAQQFEHILPAVRNEIYQAGRMEKGACRQCEAMEEGAFY